MKGKSIIFPNVYVRGDYATVRIGRYCHIGNGTIVRPPYAPSIVNINSNKNSSSNDNDSKKKEGKSTVPPPFLPILIGSNTRIGSDCIIEASSVGSSVIIGDGCVIGPRVHIKDCCYIESGTVIPEGMVIPPFSIVRGSPAKIVDGEMLPESSAVEFVDESVKLFEDFVEEEKTKDGSSAGTSTGGSQ